MVELKLDIKKQNIQAFTDVYDEEKSKSLAVENKKKAFGMLSVFDKADDIRLTHSEKRYEPIYTRTLVVLCPYLFLFEK